MKLRYLGTGPAQGFPSPFCTCGACQEARTSQGKNIKLRSSAIINDWLYIDLSPDTFAQMNRYGLGPMTTVLITHSHPDHLDMNTLFVRCQEGWNLNTPPLAVFASVDVIALIEREFSAECRKGRLELFELCPGTRYLINGISVYPIRANHIPDETCLIFALQDATGCILYGNDTGYLGDGILSGGFEYDVVSLDCSNGILPSDGHMGISDVRKTVAILAQKGRIHSGTRIVLTHFSHASQMTHDEFQRLVTPDGYLLAYDGLCLETYRPDNSF